MQLTYDQKKHFYDNGYVVVPGVVPRVMIDRAVKAINHSLGQGVDAGNLPKYRSGTYCPELGESREIMDLLEKTPAFGLVESLVGKDDLLTDTDGQIALRFPTLADPPGEPGPHLDGWISPENGTPEQYIFGFTALIGVFLSDVSTPGHGNFTVWPGTHRVFEKHFQENGPLSLTKGMPKVDMPQPVQVLANPGDIVFAHYLLAHSTGINSSPDIRYTCFFRVKHKKHATESQRMMTDKWLHWPGIRETFN